MGWHGRPRSSSSPAMKSRRVRIGCIVAGVVVAALCAYLVLRQWGANIPVNGNLAQSEVPKIMRVVRLELFCEPMRPWRFQSVLALPTAVRNYRAYCPEKLEVLNQHRVRVMFRRELLDKRAGYELQSSGRNWSICAELIYP